MSRAMRSVRGVRAIQCCLVALLSILGLLSNLVFSYRSAAEALIYPACLALVALSAWSLWSWKVATKSLFDPYVLFLAAAILFNGSHAFLELAGWNERGVLFSRVSSETTLLTLFLVILSLTCFHLGALLGIPRRRSVQPAPIHPLSVEAVRRVGWGLLLISCVPSLFSLREAISIVMDSGYSGLFQRDAATGFGATPSVLAAFLVPGALFLLAGGRQERMPRYISAFVIVTYAIIRLFLGSRSSAAMALVGYAWLWHRSIHRLRGATLFGLAALMLLVVFPLVAAMRDISGGDRLSVGALADAFFSIDNPAIAIISEIGGSMLTVAYTLDLVPESRGFDMGVGYLYALLAVVPNVFWDLHPTVQHGLAADWLVWTVAPGTASAGGGLGFSFIAEAYLNFGWYGTPMALGAMGFLFAKLTFWANDSNEPVRMAAVASFLSFVLLFARGEAASQVRALLWYAALPYGSVYMLTSIHRSAGRGRNLRYSGTRRFDTHRGREPDSGNLVSGNHYSQNPERLEAADPGRGQQR